MNKNAEQYHNISKVQKKIFIKQKKKNKFFNLIFKLSILRLTSIQLS